MLVVAFSSRKLKINIQKKKRAANSIRVRLLLFSCCAVVGIQTKVPKRIWRVEEIFFWLASVIVAFVFLFTLTCLYRLNINGGRMQCTLRGKHTSIVQWPNYGASLCKFNYRKFGKIAMLMTGHFISKWRENREFGWSAKGSPSSKSYERRSPTDAPRLPSVYDERATYTPNSQGSLQMKRNNGL